MDNSTENEVLRALGRIEGELTGIKAEMAQVSQLSIRVSALERWQSWIKGGMAACTLLSAAVLKGLFGGK